MDPLAEMLNEKLQQWRPEVAALVRELVAEVIRLADENRLDTFKLPRRLGFMKGQIRVPDDFDTMFQDEIEQMFYGEKQSPTYYKRLFDALELTLIQAGGQNGVPDMRERLNAYKTVTGQHLEDADYYHLIVAITFYSGFRAATVDSKLDVVKEWLPDYETVAAYESEQVQLMMADWRMIKNDKKLWACIRNARKFRDVVAEHGSFQNYVDSFAPQSSFENLMMFRSDLMNRFEYLAATTSLHFLMELGLPVLKPDIVITRLFHRLGFIEDEKIDETRRFQCVQIGQKFVEATGYPIRYVDIVFVGYGQVSGETSFQQGICLKDRPRCHICGVSGFCNYFKAASGQGADGPGSERSLDTPTTVSQPPTPGMKVTLPTWAGRSTFEYEGSVTEGTLICCGTEFQHRFEVPADQYAAMLARFSGQEVSIGTSRTTPPNGSLGKWMMEQYGQDAMTSYVGPILLREGYAERGSRSDLIRFTSRRPTDQFVRP